MLPFHDTPIAPRNRLKVVVSSGGKSAKPARSRDAGLLAALADPTRVVFLDVETTGLSWYYDAITVAGWMRDGHYDFHIAGEFPLRLAGALENASALVTFNGTLFDLRFLRKQFPKLPVPPKHIDLRYLAKRVGLSGGQKSIEQLLGLPQRTNAWNIDGAQAVLLWHRYLRGNTSALCPARHIPGNVCRHSGGDLHHRRD